MIYNIERPKNFDQMVGQEMVVENIRNQSIKNRFFSVFVLCGQFGSGKTTMAKIIAMAANCKHKDERGNPCGECESCQAVKASSQEGIIEIDGASNNGVDNVRALLGRAATLGLYDKKVIVIDEAHMLSKSAFNALLITLENPPEHCIFIFCTTEKDALPETVVSRAAVYVFGKIPDELVQKHILTVADRNDIQISEEAAGLLARHASGSMRNALGLLEQLSLQKLKSEMIKSNDVISILGISSVEQTASFLDGCYSGDVQMIISVVRNIERSGHSLRVFIQDVLRMNTDLLYMKSGAQIIGTKLYKDKIRELTTIPDTDIVRANQILSTIASTPANYLSADRIIVDAIGIMRTAKFSQFTEKPVGEPKEKAADEQKKVANEPETKDVTPAETNVNVQNTEDSEEDEIVYDGSSANQGENTVEELPENKETINEKEEETDISDMFSFFGGGFMGGFFGTGVVSDDAATSKKEGKKKSSEEASLTAVAGAVSDKAKQDDEPFCDDEVIPIGAEIVSDNEEPVPAQEQDDKLSEMKEDVAETEVVDNGFKDSIPVNTEGRMTWDEAAKLGIVPNKANLRLPVPESEEELDEIYRKKKTDFLNDDDEEEMVEKPRMEIHTRSHLINAQDELRKLLQDNGFKILYKKARHAEENNHINLYFEKTAYLVAAKAYLAKCKGISAILEKR